MAQLDRYNPPSVEFDREYQGFILDPQWKEMSGDMLERIRAKVSK
jgi:hypothetical protein